MKSNVGWRGYSSINSEVNKVKQLIAPMGAFDENGVFGIGLRLPWGDATGRSLLRKDMARFVEITRDRVPSEGKRNVLIVGRNTAGTFGWNPLPRRRLIIVSNTLSESELNAGREENKKIAVARNVPQAVARALEYADCGHIFLAGGETVWLEGLLSGLCNAAFITVAHCHSVELAPDTYAGDVRRMAHMLSHDTYRGMDVEIKLEKDTWGDTPVELEFRDYTKP